MVKNGLAGLVLAVVLSLSLTACQDTKTVQENEQLKAKVAELQKENGQLGSTVQTLTADRDALTKENAALKAEIKPKTTKSVKKKARKPRSKAA